MNPGTKVAVIGEVEVRAAVPGEVRALDQNDGAAVQAGAPLADLSADENHVWEALRALYLVGQRPDLEAVERYAHPIPGMRDTIQHQAQSTLEAIKGRE